MNKTIHFIGEKTSKESMFNAISTPGGLAKWWATSANGTVAKDETIQLNFDKLVTLKLRCDEFISNQKIVLTCFESFQAWDKTQLVFNIEEKNSQVFLTHIHQNISEDEIESYIYFSTKWTVYLLSLNNIWKPEKAHHTLKN